MAEYIDKDKVHKRLTILEMKLIEEEGYYDRFTKGFGECMWHIANFPAETDVVQVVRCKACKHYIAGFCARDINGRTNMFRMSENDYCSYGERKTDNG